MHGEDPSSKTTYRYVSDIVFFAVVYIFSVNFFFLEDFLSFESN